MNINLHIERLILDGLTLEQRDSPFVREAIEKELTHVLTTGGLAKTLMNGGAFASVTASAIHLIDERPKRMGKEIAQAVYSGIGTQPAHADSKMSRKK